jgi:hypothetical protein
MSGRHVHTLSGEDLRCLIRLTWITAGKDGIVDLHWQLLKAPAIAHLLKTMVTVSDDLARTVESMQLPAHVAEAAKKKTGFVNAYRAYRNSLLDWCLKNKQGLRTIITSAQKLGANDQARFDLAHAISELPDVPTPTGARSMAAANLVTTLVACLDPKRRFPIINGESGVTRRLARLELSNRSLEDKVRGFIGVIGQFGIEDAFALDVMDDDLIDKIKKRAPMAAKGVKIGGKGTKLPDLDDSEREAVLKSRTIRYRRRHNKMTTRLKELIPHLEMTQGDRQECRFDILISDYDDAGRDLLIEVKPDPDKGSVRIAIGQLFDYRRFLPHQAGTDLAILTITRPPHLYVELLQELQITSLWFADDTCHALSGDGKVWRAMNAQLEPRYPCSSKA